MKKLILLLISLYLCILGFSQNSFYPQDSLYWVDRISIGDTFQLDYSFKNSHGIIDYYETILVVCNENHYIANSSKKHIDHFGNIRLQDHKIYNFDENQIEVFRRIEIDLKNGFFGNLTTSRHFDRNIDIYINKMKIDSYEEHLGPGLGPYSIFDALTKISNLKK